MAYVRQNFEDGKILYAHQLHAIEDAIIDQEGRIDLIGPGTAIIASIDQPTDFDGLIDAGVYDIRDAAVTGNNCPSDVGGVLTVKNKNEQEYPVTQELLDSNNRLFTRYKCAAGWTEWKCRSTEEFVREELAKKLDANKLPEAIDEALAKAKASGEFDGADGKDGEPGEDGKPGADGQPGKDGEDGTDGITPHIGENGNWYIGDTDTNIPASADYRTWIVTIQADEHGFAASHSSNEIYEWVENKGIALAFYRSHYYTLVGCSEEFARFLCHDEAGDDRYITLCGFRAYEGIVSHEGYVRTVNGVKPDKTGNVELLESAAYGWEDISDINIPGDGTVEIWMKDDYVEVLPINIDGVVKSVNGVEPDESGNVEIPDSGEISAIEIFPETYFGTERGDGFEWDRGEVALFFNLNYHIKEGTTYLVTVNGAVHSVTAGTKYWGADLYVSLTVPDTFDIFYAESGFINVFGSYKAAYQPKEWIEDEDGMAAFTPVTIGIRQEAVFATEEWVEKKLEEHSGGVDFETDETLTLENGVLSVNTDVINTVSDVEIAQLNSIMQ